MSESDSWMASASQLSTWSRCRRKWYFEKVLKLFAPVHPSAELGTRCHSALEHYLKTGERTGDADVQRILALVWDSVWFRRLVQCPDIVVEKPVLGLVIGGVGISDRSRIDLQYRAECVSLRGSEWTEEDIPAPSRAGRCMVIVDHKSTSNFTYAKSKEEAYGDPQTVVYGADAFRDPEIEEVLFVYHYFRTRGVACLPRYVIVRHTRSTLEPLLTQFATFLDEMRQMRDLPLEAIPRNTDACWDFGGCPFKQPCFDEEETQLTLEQITMSTGIDFNSLLSAHAAEQGTTPKNTNPVFVPPPKVPAVSVETAVQNNPPASTGGLSGGAKASENVKPSSFTGDDRPVLFPAMGKEVFAHAKPIILFGCTIPGVVAVELEELAQPFIEAWQRANKDVHYLNSDFFKAERVIAVNLIASMARGEVSIPPVVYVRGDSPIGRYFRAEMRLLKDRVIQVIPMTG